MAALTLRSRIALITVGSSPRPDVVGELLTLAGIHFEEADFAEFGALDGLGTAQLKDAAGHQRGGRLYTRLRSAEHVVVSTSLVASRLETLLESVDQEGFDLLVLSSTGLFRPFPTRTPLVHLQEVVDAWIATLIMGDCTLGLIHHLTRGQRGFSHGTVLQNARAVEAAGVAGRLEETVGRLAEA